MLDTLASRVATRTLHVVPHAQRDRGWDRPCEGCRYRLAALSAK